MWNAIMGCTCADKWGGYAPLILRVALGAVMMYHGYLKIFVMGMPGVTGFLGGLGIPLPALFAPILAYTEFIGGAFLIAGFLTHWVSKLTIVIALVAFYTVHMPNGFNVSKGGYEFIMLIGAAAVSLMITGAGPYSVDAKMKK
jgi:putative oxidoreductase